MHCTALLLYGARGLGRSHNVPEVMCELEPGLFCMGGLAEDCVNQSRAEMVMVMVGAVRGRSLLRFPSDLRIEGLGGTSRGVRGVVGDVAPMLPLVPSCVPELPNKEAGPPPYRAF